MSAQSWQRKGVGRKADSLFAVFAALSGVLILLVLAYMVISTTGTALPVFGSQGISFVTSSVWSPSNGQFGSLAFIYGTIITSVIALIVAVPLSIGVALFLTEYSPKRLRGPIGYAVDLLAAVPSVIYGLWGVFILLPLFLQPAADFLNKYLGFIPVFGGPASGLSYFGAGVILSIMITPIITSLCREVFETVPNADRHAAYALGATKWEMIRQAVLPRGRAGIVGATMLGLGRALGETIAVALLIGSSVRVDASILTPGYSMAAVIANQFQEATGDHIRALVGIGVVLFALTIIINMGARALVEIQPGMSTDADTTCPAGTSADGWAGSRIGPGVSLKACSPTRRRVWRNRRNTAFVLLAVGLTMIPVVMILYQITAKGIATMDWEFLTSSMPFSFRREGGGFLNGLVGTALMVGLATVVSIPLGILAAVYLVEYGKKNWLAKLIRFFSDVMTGVPSVFVGLFVYTALVIQFGFGALMGAASLAIIMMPIIVRSTEEMLKLVPLELKDASYALGAAKWQTIVRVILPSAAPGITTGVMLAVARAAGETAPLILTALGSYQLTAKLWGAPMSSLTLAIFDGARNPFVAGQARAWAGALELLIIVLVFTIVARVVASRSRISR